jgi:TonB-linked SusC/RagA family outer membrane protein
MNQLFFKMICSLTFFVCVANSSSNAQTSSQRVTVRGNIIDRKDKQEVIGASVSELDKDDRVITATVSDISGNFALRVSNPQNRIKFSMIGYRNIIQQINARTVINVSMDAMASQLDELVITSKRVVNTGGGLNIDARNSTMATSSINAKDLEEMASASIDQALAGRLPGVDIGTTSGDPGAGMSIRIRGTSSLNGSSDPMIVLDGMPYEIQVPSDFNFGTADEQGYAQLLNIAPADIKDITVLKDAASTAMWGARAANGVLVINTKRGMVGRPSITYTLKGSMRKQPNPIPTLNGDQFSMLMPESIANRNLLPLNRQANKEFQYDPNDPYYYYNYSNNTDWIGAITRLGSTHDHNISMTGGGEKARYYASVGYLGDKGVNIGTDLSRITTKVNLDYIVYTHVLNNLNYTNTIRNIAYQKLPNMAVYEYDEYGNQTPVYFSPSLNIQGGYNVKDAHTYNPLAMANEGRSSSKGERITPKFFIKYDVLSSLTATADFQFDINNTKSKNFLPQIATGRPSTELVVNRAADNDGDSYNFATKVNLAFNPAIKNPKHVFQSLLSLQTNESRGYSHSVSTANTASSLLQDPSSPSRTQNDELRLESTYSLNRSIGGVAQVHYGLLDRYMIDLIARGEGSSRFGPNNRYGLFPGIATRWRISGEPFMKNVKMVNELSVRLSWGQSGNSPGTGFYNLYVPFGWTYQSESALYPSSMKLNNLKWETVTGTNLGFNLQMFNKKIVLDAEIYRNRTSDMLFNGLQTPSHSGFNSVSMNIGTMDNQGFEIGINTTPVRNRNWIVGFDLNIAKNNNILRSVSEFYPRENGNRINGNGAYKTYLQIGNPFGSFYGFKYKGVYKDQDATYARDEEGNKVTGPTGQLVRMRFNYPLTDYTFEAGDAIYEDINQDGNIDYKDIVYLGNGVPKITGGFGPNITFKRNIRLSAFFSYRLGYDLINQTEMLTTNMYSFNNQSTAVLRRWRNPGDETDIPRALYQNGFNWLGSDRYVQDASFVRLRTVTLRYTLANKMLDNFNLKSGSFYFTAENLLTFTSYTGQDPDVNTRGNTSPFQVNMDNSMTPPSKVFTMGLVVGF